MKQMINVEFHTLKRPYFAINVEIALLNSTLRYLLTKCKCLVIVNCKIWSLTAAFSHLSMSQPRGSYSSCSPWYISHSICNVTSMQ